MYFKVTMKTHFICLIISLFLTAVLFKPISDISYILYIKEFNTGTIIVFLCVVMISVTFAHEIIHAAVFKLFGGVVKVGFKGIYTYTQEISGIQLTRTQFSIILLSPTVVISVLGMIISGWFGAIVFVLNIVGAVGDLYMTFNLIKYGPCKIVDKPFGFEIRV